MKKDLFKPGRVWKEYIDEAGSLKVNCRTCIRRKSLTGADEDSGAWGQYLCKYGRNGYLACNPGKVNPLTGEGLAYLNWEPRVDGFIKEKEFSI